MKLFTTKCVTQIKLPAQYTKWTARESCIAREECWMRWIVNQGAQGMLAVPNRNSFDYYVQKEHFQNTLKKLADDMQKNWKEHLKRYQEKKEKIIETAEQLKNILPTKKNQEILHAFRRFSQNMYNFGEYIFSPWAVIVHIEPLIIKHFSDNLDVIMSLEKPIMHLNMEKEIFHLSPQRMVEKYAWLKMYSPHDPPYTQKDFLKMKKEIKKEQIKKTFSQFSKTKKAFQHFLESVKDQKMKRELEMVHTYAFLKTDRIDTMKKSMYYLRSFYEYLTTLSPGLTIHKTVHLSSEEIKNLITQGKLPPNLNIRAANKAMYHYQEDVLEILTDQKEIKKIKKLLEEQHTQTKEVQGIVACKGKATGRAKIINHSKDLKKIRKGDIFVAKYTFPSFTSAMIKCAAIITDDGGITSHAAILSREYHIPCIIGTGNATQVFKDNDRVEVNAEKGRARKK